jgi:hypothetical protein
MPIEVVFILHVALRRSFLVNFFDRSGKKLSVGLLMRLCMKDDKDSRTEPLTKLSEVGRFKDVSLQ